MSWNTLTRTLQKFYPVIILLTVLAAAGMNLVQASGTDPFHRLSKSKMTEWHEIHPALKTHSIESRSF